jgi:hypothetical protein
VDRKHCAWRADLNRCICRSRRRVGWCDTSVVEIPALPVLQPGQDVAVRCGVALQLVRDDHTRDVLQALQQLAEEPLGSLGASPALHENVEHVAVLVDRTPETVLLAANADKHLVQEPLVARPRRRRFSSFANCRPKRRPHSRIVSWLTTTLGRAGSARRLAGSG